MRIVTTYVGLFSAAALLLCTDKAFSGPAEDSAALVADTAYKVVVKQTAPTNTWLGTRGLSQTSSAEGLGEGRLVLGLQGAGWYKQDRELPGAPNRNADIFAGTGSAAWGINNYVDGFAFISGYGSNNYHSNHASGLGTVGGGVQASTPIAPLAPVKFAVQLGVFNGLSDNQVNNNRADGYDYFQTRTQMDFLGRLIQTIAVGPEAVGFKVSANEALVTSLEKGREPLMLLATSAQIDLPYFVAGLELNSRTNAKNIDMVSDPLWITPSLQIRTNYNVNLTMGTDISLSRPRQGSDSRALEPYRLFGGLAFTFDTRAEKRRQQMEERRHAAIERLQLRDKAREDSLTAARAQQQADSIAAVAEATQQSLQQSLQQEQAKTAQMENQLLTTGMLMLDNVYFQTNRADISLNSKPYLNVIAKILTKYPKLQIEVGGHTDNVGTAAYNQLLSQQRADAVVAYMVGQEPSLNGRLFGKGYGEANPKNSNSTPEGRMMNRRTELQVLNKDVLKEYQPSA